MVWGVGFWILYFLFSFFFLYFVFCIFVLFEVFCLLVGVTIVYIYSYHNTVLEVDTCPIFKHDDMKGDCSSTQIFCHIRYFFLILPIFAIFWQMAFI